LQATDVAASAAQKTSTPTPSRRRMGTRFSLPHLVTLLAGLLAMLLVFAVLRGGEATSRVAVAAREVRAGAPLARSALRFTDLRAPGAIREQLVEPDSLAGLEGWIATRTIAPGDLVTRGDFRPPAAVAQQRAMSVPVDPAHAVGGALDAGDRVDVIRVLDNGQAVFVVAGAQVLGVNRPDPSAIGPDGAYSLTLAVSSQDALRLAAAIRSEKFEVIRSTGTGRVPVGPDQAQPGAGGDQGQPGAGADQGQPGAGQGAAGAGLGAAGAGQGAAGAGTGTPAGPGSG
jgi:Flp pilus assembly protein CpaB